MQVRYVTTKDIAIRWGLTENYVRGLCSEGRIRGAQRFGCIWSIPENATWDVPDKSRFGGKTRTNERSSSFFPLG